MLWSPKRNRQDDDIEAELQYHAEMLAKEHSDDIADPTEARHAAKRKLGNSTLIREEIYNMNHAVLLETGWQDFGYAARTLRKSPGFAIAAIITLALGVGASTAIFSVADAVLLRPLPYRDSGRLIYACADLKTRNVYDHLWSGPNYIDLREGARSSFEDVGAVATTRISFPHDDGTPEEAIVAQVTPNFFRLLGRRVVLGRDFIESDGLADHMTADGAPPPPDQRLPTYAIASSEFFERTFHGNPAALGRPAWKHGPVLIGVAEPGVELLFRPDKSIDRHPDLWMALRLSYAESYRQGLYLRVIARLRPGVALQRAQSQADAVARRIGEIDPAFAGAGLRFRLEPMHPYLVASVRPAILALMGAVIFLLLIACSNVANLFLVRTSLRSRDLAVRSAMGAGWWRLARQMLAEALLLSAIGSLLGFGLAWLGIHDLMAIAPANLPRLDEARMNPSVLVFSVIAGVIAAALFALAPVLRAARPDVAQVLRESGRSGGLSGAPWRNAVVVIEVALCFVLLVGSGLMFRSFLALQRIDPGFDPRGVLTFRAMGGKSSNSPEERAAMKRDMQRALTAIPGVESATAANILPLSGQFFPNRWGMEDSMNDLSKLQAADLQVVLPGYFETMRTPLIAGRTFNDSDANPNVKRIIVDQALAAKAFPSGGAVGQRIVSRLSGPTNEWYEIIGVVAHQRLTSLAEPGREQIYTANLNAAWVSAWAVRTKGDPAKYAAMIREEMAKFDRSMLLIDVQTMDSILDRAETGTRFSLLLIGVFAGIAVLLAGVGLYGVLSTMVRQRTAEIGVRMALGAAPRGIFGLMIGYGLRLSAIGIGAGFLAALALTQAMKSMLVDITPTDPVTFGTMAALFFLIAVAATWIPARRAAGLDPLTALRQE